MGTQGRHVHHGLRVLHLIESDLGGGAMIAVDRLHRGLLHAGVDSQWLVMRAQTGDPSVHAAGSGRLDRRMLLRKKLERAPLRLYPRRPFPFSLAMLPDGIAKRVEALAPTHVHLHWVNDGFVRIETLAKIRRPIVWTLHDMWPFTGGCHYAGACRRFEQACGACPQLGSKGERDLTRWVFRRKQREWRDTAMRLVAPSAWLAGEARRSALFREAAVGTIPNGIELDEWRPGGDQLEARMRLALPPKGPIVLLGANGLTQDPRKGAREGFAALARLAQDGIAVAIFGDRPDDLIPPLPFPVFRLGHLDPAGLRTAFAAADVFLAPSREDNLPNTVLEAMACGRATAAFHIGGLPDLVESGVSGHLAEPYDLDALAESLRLCVQNAVEWGKNARRRCEHEFGIEAVVDRYVEVYLGGNVVPT